MTLRKDTLTKFIAFCLVLLFPFNAKAQADNDSILKSDCSPDTTYIPRRPALALRTNLLYDGFYMPHFGWAPMPDVELEFFPRGGNLSFIAAFTFPYWNKEDKHKFFQIRDYRAELRYCFRNSWQQRKAFFLGLTGNYNEYGIGLSKRKGWQGEGWGGGMTLGFVHRLGQDSRWRMEYSIGLGYYETRFDPYVYGNPISGDEDDLYYYDYTGRPADFLRRNHRRKWFGPTSVGITLSYDLLYYKTQRRGLGTKRKEMAE